MTTLRRHQSQSYDVGVTFSFVITSMKLFAGISTVSVGVKPASRPSCYTASMSRYPHSAFWLLRLASNVAFPSDVCSPFLLNGP